ncbi:MAG: hypothetical protein RQM90_11045 [Methanoculleus sp.]|nr:hypothetical protein [Methanoculleus sp.]
MNRDRTVVMAAVGATSRYAAGQPDLRDIVLPGLLLHVACTVASRTA